MMGGSTLVMNIAMLPKYSMIPKLFYFPFYYVAKFLAKFPFGWSPAHQPHKFEKEKHW
jgi:hypothetical protein